MAAQIVEFVHVVNLNKDKERLSRFRDVNSHLPIVRQPAVDGGSLDRGQLREQGYIAENLSYDNHNLGNALSHIELWRRAVEGQATITIAEDDAIFARDFVATANALLQRLPNDWDIMMWGWNFDAFLWVEMPEGVSLCKIETNQHQLRRNIDAFRPGHFIPTPIRLRHSFGTMAYTVSADGAAKLLESCLPLRDQLIPFPGFDVVIENTSIDAMMNAVYPGIRAYVSIPPLAVSENRHRHAQKNPTSPSIQEKHVGGRQNDFTSYPSHGSRASRLRIVVLGFLIRGPSGGLAWHYLNYMLGLAELGHDVYFIEASGDRPECIDPTFSYCNADPTYGLHFASDAFARLGLGCRWAYYDGYTKEWRGARARDARELCETADLVLNVSGKNVVRDFFEHVPVRAFIDTDPGFTQIQNLTDPGFRRYCEEHTVFFSFAENIGRPGCRVPIDGFAWKPTRQPVALDAWPYMRAQRNGRYTTVMSWQSYHTRIYQGLRLATKNESFPQFAELPRRLGERFELAISGTDVPRSTLREAGWRIADLDAVIHDPWTYQAFIQASKAEFGIAKQGYVVTHSGWFSERSAVYLASGRPVLAQDTGFPEWLPCGEGVLVFRSPEDVVDAISRVEADYDAHCHVARELAGEYFAARRVLLPLIEAAMETHS